jgi:myo-inositol-1(or 4)-monophosphatase
MINLHSAKSLAVHLARSAGKILLDNERKVSIVKKKDKRDFCTQMDLKIEKYLIREILKVYPDHNIFSEEIGDLKKKSDYVWIIDPIDGTKHFISNIPLFTVSIALQYKNEIVLGVVYNPSTHHTYHAFKGGGAYINNTLIKVSKTNNLREAIVYLDFAGSHNLPKLESKKMLDRLNKFVTGTYRIRALGVGSLGMCYLAQGAYDVYFDLTGKTKYVDIAAGAIIVQESGGHVLDFSGGHLNRQSRHFLAVNDLLKDKIKKLTS